MFLSRVSHIPMFILDTARLLPTRHGMDTSEDTSVSRKRPVAAVALMSGTCITFVPCSYGWLGNYWWKLNLKGEKGNKKSEGISRWNIRFQRFLRLESRVLFKTSIYFNIVDLIWVQWAAWRQVARLMEMQMPLWRRLCAVFSRIVSHLSSFWQHAEDGITV